MDGGDDDGRMKPLESLYPIFYITGSCEYGQLTLTLQSNKGARRDYPALLRNKN